jgi:DNA-binding beta-propeller fold protein YncE
MTRLHFILFILLLLSVVFDSELPAQVPMKVSGHRLDVSMGGDIYVLNTDRNILTLFTKERVAKHEIGGTGWGNEQFDRPAGIWARNGIDVFVADYVNHRIQRFDKGLNYISTLYTRENLNPGERFGYPSDVALSRLGYLFVCDTENSRIAKVNQFSQVERTFGGFDAGKGRLFAPTQVECGPKDRVYVLDGLRVVVFDNFGNFLRSLAGEFRPPVTLYADGQSAVVVDSSTMFCFDDEERPASSLPLETLLDLGGNEIRSVAFSQDSMFVLTAEGLLSIVDPRQMAKQR